MADLYHSIFEKYLPRNLSVRNVRTRELYGFAYQSLARFLSREPDWPDLNDDTFAAWMTHLLVVDQLAETTINGYRAKLRAFWEWAARKRIVDQFPTVGRIPVPERFPVAWRENELERLFNACRSQRGSVGDVPAWRWWFTIHGWWWCTGERIGATLAMRVEHLRLDEGLAVLPAEIRKGRRKGAVHALWPDLVMMLRSMLPPNAPPRTFVFEWDQHRDRGTFYNHYRRMLIRARLPHDRYHKPHCMRVSVATWTELMGGNPTKKLGHGDPGTTRKSYIDPTLGTTNEAQLFRPWGQLPPGE